MEFNTPKNFKRGRLIANKYKVIDIVVTGIANLFSAVTIIAYLILKGKNVFTVFLLLIPSLVTITMVTPIYFYHNWYEYCKLYFIYFFQNKKYIWEGIYKYDDEEI